MGYCQTCGEQINARANYCGHCGNPIEWDSDTSEGNIPKDKKLNREESRESAEEMEEKEEEGGILGRIILGLAIIGVGALLFSSGQDFGAPIVFIGLGILIGFINP